MAQIWRVTATWTGGKIGTGFTNFFFSVNASTAQLSADAMRKFFSDSYSIGAFLPTGITISFPSVVDTIEATNGQLTSNTPITKPADIVGSDGTRYAAVAGACATWRTGDFVAGHRVRGRTFLVPVGGGALQSDGTLDSTFLGFVTGAGATLVAAAPEFVIWRRPSSTAAANGSTHIVAACTVSDKTAYLTSRR